MRLKGRVRTEFLQARNHNLGQVRLLVAVGDLYGLVQLAFAQRAGHGRSEQARLLARGIVNNQTVDHHAD